MESHTSPSLLYVFRLSDFMVMGPGTFYRFDDEKMLLANSIFGKGTVGEALHQSGPRLSASLLLKLPERIKLSYNRMAQNLHQLTNSTSALPTDQYVLSSLNIKPQLADHIAFGYFRNSTVALMNFQWSPIISHANQIDFRTGADLPGYDSLKVNVFW